MNPTGVTAGKSSHRARSILQGSCRKPSRLLSPVEVERNALREMQRNEGLGCVSFALTPGADENRNLAIACGVALLPYLREKCTGSGTILLGPVGVSYL